MSRAAFDSPMPSSVALCTKALGAYRRARAHRAVATALEELCGQRPGARIGELARHWSSARPLDAVRAVGYARQAGDAALRSLAPTDALRYYSEALELLAAVDGRDPVLELDLVIGRGTAQRQIGDPSFRSTLLSAAHQAAELGDTGRLVRAALANNRGWLSSAGAVDAEKVEILELLLDRVPPGSPDRALVLAALCSELAYGSSLERRQSLAQEAIVTARSSDDDATIVRVLNHVFIPLLRPVPPGGGIGPHGGRHDPRRTGGRPCLAQFGCGQSRHHRRTGGGLRRAGPLYRRHEDDGREARPAQLHVGAALHAGDPGADRRRYGTKPSSWPRSPSASDLTAANPTRRSSSGRS